MITFNSNESKNMVANFYVESTLLQLNLYCDYLYYFQLSDLLDIDHVWQFDYYFCVRSSAVWFISSLVHIILATDALLRQTKFKERKVEIVKTAR